MSEIEGPVYAPIVFEKGQSGGSILDIEELPDENDGAPQIQEEKENESSVGEKKIIINTELLGGGDNNSSGENKKIII
jgi:hypothetical protein